MAKGKGSPDEERVAIFYEKLTGRNLVHGNWNIEERNFAQRIVWVEEACRSVLAAIEKLEKSGWEDKQEAVSELKTELRFLNTLGSHTET